MSLLLLLLVVVLVCRCCYYCCCCCCCCFCFTMFKWFKQSNPIQPKHSYDINRQSLVSFQSIKSEPGRVFITVTCLIQPLNCIDISSNSFKREYFCWNLSQPFGTRIRYVSSQLLALPSHAIWCAHIWYNIDAVLKGF